jgi:ubiquinone/menaquinone biosynthesis C-methylase UbiE/gas vesicle protein
MSEFTGERVIPGRVTDDLWAEHFSRYAFAARLSAGRRALDIGCGTGYGATELARAARFTVACDNAPEALAYAQLHYPEPQFVLASATSLPFADASFDLITAFEVIEHLKDWPQLLKESARVLSPGGLLLVSTPNKLYYAESRAESGPNPFHQHEFEYSEFRAALGEMFSHTAIYLQNHVGAFAISPAEHYAAAEGFIDVSSASPEEANFFLAICSNGPVPEPAALLYAPKAGNILRERERHIKLLETELSQNKTWLAETMQDRERLQAEHAELLAHLDHQNQWARELEQNWKQATERIAAVQEELQRLTEGYENQIAILQKENQDKTQWALDTEKRLSAELQAKSKELAKTVQLLEQAEATVVERTRWAQTLELELRENLDRLAMIQQSYWLKLGRVVGFGPSFPRKSATKNPDGGASKE